MRPLVAGQEHVARMVELHVHGVLVGHAQVLLRNAGTPFLLARYDSPSGGVGRRGRPTYVDVPQEVGGGQRQADVLRQGKLLADAPGRQHRRRLRVLTPPECEKQQAVLF